MTTPITWKRKLDTLNNYDGLVGIVDGDVVAHIYDLGDNGAPWKVTAGAESIDGSAATVAEACSICEAVLEGRSGKRPAPLNAIPPGCAGGLA